MFFGSFKWLIRLALKLYYKGIQIEGLENIPKSGPVLVSPNHQNAFMDALLVGAFSPLPLFFLARSDIFNWWTRPILRQLRIIPIYRIRDGYSSLSENNKVFKQCHDLFSAGKSVLIFSEGNHGIHSYLRPLTKGSSRLALSYEGDGLQVLPVGINYFEHTQPQSHVLIAFGRPIGIEDQKKSYQTSTAKALIRFRDQLAESMKQVLVIPEDGKDYEALAKEVFQEKYEGYKLNELRSVTPGGEEQGRIYRKHYLAKILNPVPFIISYLVISNVKDVVFHTSLKFAIGFLLFPVWWMGMGFLITSLFGFKIGILSMCMMITGLYYSYQR